MAKKANGHAAREELLAAMPDQDGKLKEAEALLQADRDARKQQFLTELQALCQKYRCDVRPVLQVVAQ